MAAPNAQQFAKLTSAVSSLVEALDKNTTSRPGGETDELTDKFKTLGKELVSVGEAGRKLAQSLGTSFVGGVELELANSNIRCQQSSVVITNHFCRTVLSRHIYQCS